MEVPMRLLGRAALFIAIGGVLALKGVLELPSASFLPLWPVLAVVCAIGLEVVGTVFGGEEDALAFRVRRAYLPALVVAAAVTGWAMASANVYAAPYAPYCEGMWKYINWLACL
jgi:hypothetical protein